MPRPDREFLLGGDLTIDRLGFGAMRLARSGLQGPARERQEALAVLRRAVELGVNHIDTAWFYRAGDLAANDLIREALSPYPGNLVIATKVGPLLGPSGRPEGQCEASGLRELVEENLTTLGLDRLDLVYLRIGGRSEASGESIGERFEALAAEMTRRPEPFPREPAAGSRATERLRGESDRIRAVLPARRRTRPA